MVWSAGAILTAAQLNTYLPQTWTSYTPTWSGNVTQGNGTRTGGYIQYGKTVHFWARFVLGTTSSIGTGAAAAALPVAAASPGLECLSRYTDTGSNFYFGRATIAGSVANCYVVSTNGFATSITATVPFTWATTDEIFVSGTYQAA